MGWVAVKPLSADRRAARSRQPALRLAPLALIRPPVTLRPLRRVQVKVTESRRLSVWPRHKLTGAQEQCCVTVNWHLNASSMPKEVKGSVGVLSYRNMFLTKTRM